MAFMKIAFALILLCIVLALAMAGRAMLGDDGRDPAQSKSRRMFRSLALRVALSVGLFLFILVSYHLGWIRPTGIAL